MPEEGVRLFSNVYRLVVAILRSADLKVSFLQINKTTVEYVCFCSVKRGAWSTRLRQCEVQERARFFPLHFSGQTLSKGPSQSHTELLLSNKSKCLHYKRWLESTAGLLEHRRPHKCPLEGRGRANRRCGASRELFRARSASPAWHSYSHW